MDVEVRRERNKVMDLDFMMGEEQSTVLKKQQRIGGEAHKIFSVVRRDFKLNIQIDGVYLSKLRQSTYTDPLDLYVPAFSYIYQFI